MADLTISEKRASDSYSSRMCRVSSRAVRLHQALLLNRELALFLVQVDEDADLRAKDVRLERLEEIVPAPTAYPRRRIPPPC